MKQQNKAYEKILFHSDVAELESNLRNSYHEFLLQFLRRHNITPRGRILEAGCGRGTFGKWLLHSFAGIEIIGVDISEQMVSLANNNTPSYHAIMGDLEDETLFAKHSFDGIVCYGALHHFPDLTRVAMNFFIWCKPGGVIILTEPNGDNIIRQLSAMLRRIIEISLGKQFVLERGWATPNEVNHTFHTYKTMFTSSGFHLLRMEPYTTLVLPAKLRSVYDFRTWLFHAQWKLFPRALFSAMEIAMLFQKDASSEDVNTSIPRRLP